MFRGDTRGQSVQVGVIILLAFAVIGFSSYQAVVVPQQNQEVEFDHSREVRSDVTALHDGVMNAALNGDQPFTGVTLGVSYPSRLVALNPPPVGGRIHTTTERSISVGTGQDICPDSDDSPDGDDDTTRAIQYSAAYNYLDNPATFRIENSYMYRQYDDGALSGVTQQLVSDGRINLVPIRNEYSETGSDATSLDIVPGAVKTTTVESETTLTLPTALSQEQWREAIDDELLAEDDDTDIVVEDKGDDDPTNNELKLTLPKGQTIVCTPVGIGGDPPSGVRGDGVTVGGDTGGGLNPSGAGDVRLVGIGRGSSNGDIITLNLENTGDTVTLDTSRFAFYFDGGTSNGPQQLDILKPDGTELVSDLQLRGERGETTETFELSGGETTELRLRFEKSNGNVFTPDASDFVVINQQFSDGQQSNYYVDIPKKKTGGGTGSLGKNEVAYDDENDNGVYDSNEETYKENDLKSLTDNTANLVIAKEVSPKNSGVSVETSTVTVNPGVTVSSKKNEVKLTAFDGDVDLQDAKIDGGGGVTLKAGTSSGAGDIRAEDAKLVAKPGSDMKVTPASGNKLFVNSNGGGESNGGTYIVDRDGAESSVSLEQGDYEVTPEKGSVTDNS